MTIVVVLLFLFVIAFIIPLSSSQRFNVLNYGARPDGKTDSTKAFQSAWQNTCGSSSPATLYVPPGRFLLRNVTFEGPCQNNDTLVIIDGTVVALSDHQVVGDAACWILFEHVEGVTVSGGILDGPGSALWGCEVSGRSCTTGTRAVCFSNAENIEISGLTSLNSPLFHIMIDHCQNVKISGVKISAPSDSPNTSGIRVQSSTDITISNSSIEIGDDCISVGPGAPNPRTENVTCGPGHGISVESLSKTIKEEGVQNVTVNTTSFTKTQNRARNKSQGRP